MKKHHVPGPAHDRTIPTDRDVTMDVTTNPSDAVPEGGSTPLGADDQDSRTWPSDEARDTQKGGDRSNRAAASGATGERGTSGGRNKPEPKDQDEKGMGHPRNR
jgi:hypothetical protein